MADVGLSDEDLKKRIVNHLYWDTRVDASSITVRVENGEVTLSGEVPTYSSKEAAEDAARNIDEAIPVFNELNVEIPVKDVPQDDEIQSRVLDTLEWDTELDSTKIQISVDDGHITLEGTVDSGWKKFRAENKLTELDGVVDVTNELSVVPTENILDESIAEDIVESLERNLHTPAEEINVMVEDGDVTLSGTVSTWRAREEAFDTALRTAGVANVDNNIVVESREASPV
ncbi:MAG: BON domain-containing protein [bacterium]